MIHLNNLTGMCVFPLSDDGKGWYLNFIAWFMQNILFEQRKIKLRIKLLFVENKMEIMQHVLKMHKFTCCLNI
jgi:hypothetical protein